MEFLDQLLNFGDEVSSSAPLADRLMLGLQTTLLGMGVVFAVLILLWAVLSVFKTVFYKGGKQEESATSTAVIGSEPSPMQPTAPQTPAPVQSDAELIAVITAAVAVMMDAPGTSFRVVSFRRTAKK